MRTSRRIVLIVICVLCIVALRAAPPAWWTDDNAQTRILTPGATAANFAPANLGQLKFVATQAKKHLDQNLAAIGGAGPEIDQLVANFAPSAGQNAANYTPINLGQLKAVANPFYKRLLAVGYQTRANLLAHGFPSAGNYPWDTNDPANQAGSGDKSMNYAVANQGQLKMVFSFDLAGVDVTQDTDLNGLPDGWEMSYFGYIGVDPNALAPSGDEMSIMQKFQAGVDPYVYQTVPEDQQSPIKLVVYTRLE
jgi:hypothetical protein